MFCPVCKYEYNKDIIKCPDCGSALVTEPSAEAEKLDFDTVKIADLRNEIEEGIITAALEEEEIEFFITRNYLPHTRIGFDFTKPVSYGTLYVNKEKKDKAEQIYKDLICI